MENEVKQRTQRNRRRERAQRMQAQKRENKVKNGGADSGEDESPTREKPQRPPPPSRRKKSKDPVFEEDVIDGFSILSFKTYEELENSIRLCGKGGCAVTLGWEAPKVEPLNNHHTRANNTTNNNHLEKGSSQPPSAGTSDDNARDRVAPLRATPRAPSHDRLSDASSRCSSGRGYICDSEGDDDKGSDAGSILFTPTVRKHELPGLPTNNHPPVLNNGTMGTGSPGRGTPSPPPPAKQPSAPMAPPSSAAPASPARQPSPPPPLTQPLPLPAAAPTIPHFPISNGPMVGHPSHPKLPTPSPPIQMTAHSPRSSAIVSSAYPPPPNNYPPPTATSLSLPPTTHTYLPPPHTTLYQPPICSVSTSSSPVVVAAPSSYVPAPISMGNAYPPLYAPYSNTPYLPPISHPSRVNRSPMPVISSKSAAVTTTASPIVTTTTTTSHRDIVSTPLVGRSHSPRGHSPTRERDSYSSNVSSLSRGSVTPVQTNSSPFSAPAPAPAHSTPSSLAYSKPPVWVGGSSSTQLSPVTAVPRHPLSHASHPHPFPPPMFAPPVAAAPTAAVSSAPPTNPNPFSAESLFQSNQADLLRRELDNRFLASQDRAMVPPPYLRTEMHHHQHQHTHVHQHAAPLLPPPPSTLFAPPIFKDIPKLGGVDSPFYRQNLGLSSYPGFSPGLLHPTIGAATPFAPPNHLPTFTPKQLTDNTKPKPVKTGKWNAMHVRIAWEIYNHQQKQVDVKPAHPTMVGGSTVAAKSELLRPPTHMFPPRPHEMAPFSTPHRAPHPFENSTHPAAGPFPGLGSSMFGRYPPSPAVPSLATFPHTPLYDPWTRLQPRTSSSFPAPIGANVSPWSLKPEPGLSEAEREREREREREKERERSRERERQRREEKQRRLLVAQQQQQQQNKVRERSPLREPPNPTVVPKEEEVVLLGRPPPPHYLPRHPPRTLPPHFAPTPWDHPYRYDPLRFNPLMAAFREEEEQRAKLFASYPPPPHLRGKAPSPHRPPHHSHVIPHPDHKKEESSQSR